MVWIGKDKRKYVRAAAHCKIFMRIPGREHIIVCHTENIGEGGIGVKIDEKLDASSLVFIDLCIQNEKILLEGKVVYTSNMEENPLYYKTGIEFQNLKKKNRLLIRKYVNEIISEG